MLVFIDIWGEDAYNQYRVCSLCPWVTPVSVYDAKCVILNRTKETDLGAEKLQGLSLSQGQRKAEKTGLNGT